MITAPPEKEKLSGTFRITIFANDTVSGEERVVEVFNTHDVTIRRSTSKVELTLTV